MPIHEEPIERPNLEQYSDTPIFNTKAVVQQTGVPAPTLRAWERRYRLLTPERANNAYRLYSERDIALIHWLKDRIDHGLSISQAIALFRHIHEEHEQLDQHLSHETHIQPFHSTVEKFHVAFPEASPLEKENGQAESEEHLMHQWPHFETASDTRSTLPVHNMRVIQERLIEAFLHLDEQQATLMMGSMLAIYSVEQVCKDLITPTMWQIGRLWSEGKVTVSEEHFASNFFRALLTNLFHVTPGPRSGPLTIVCCAPGEPHELAALMLALFLRRSNTRVAYLGQSIEVTGLLHTIKKLTPALICVSLTMPAYLPALIHLARQIQILPPPRPIFTFGGQVFRQYTDIIDKIPGVHLDGDLEAVTTQLRNLVLERLENKN